MASKLKLLSSMAPCEALAAIIRLYESCGLPGIEAHAAGGVEVARRVISGEHVDIVVLASDAIDQLIGNGQLSATGRVDVMTSRIAVAVRAGSRHPAIEDVAGVLNAVTSAAKVSYSTGPSGRYLETLFEQWGILESLRSRIIIPPPGVRVAQLIAAGYATLGFQQLSEMRNAPGIDVVGTLPKEIQSLTTFAAGITPTCTDPTAAAAFLSFLTSTPASDVIRSCGMTAVDENR